jgi:YVTN family beta-propeller protein
MGIFHRIRAIYDEGMRRILCMAVLAAMPFTASAGQVLLAVHKGTGELAYYSLEGKLLDAVKVGEHPHELALSPDAKFAYITDNGTMRIEQAGKGGNTVSIVDIAARKRTGTISTGKYRRPHGISVDPRTGYLAVTAEAPDRVLHIDPRDRKVIRHFDTRGRTSHMVTLAPGTSGAEFAFVSNSGLESVSVVHLTSGVVKKIPAGERPEGSVLSKDGRELYVCNRESNTITIIDVARQAAIGEIKTGGKGPVRIAATPDGTMLVYALMHDGKIEFTDLSRRRPVAQTGVEGQPVSIAVSPDGKWAFAASEERDLIHVISIAGRNLVRSFATAKGAAPDALALVNLP